jgi:hypothetical protein
MAFGEFILLEMILIAKRAFLKLSAEDQKTYSA